MTTFLSLGLQPRGNDFRQHAPKKSLSCEFLKDLGMIKIHTGFTKEESFNENYPYYSSCSTTMCNHFENVARMIKEDFKPQKILEIGSNDGVFIKHFDPTQAVCVEPCKNFAQKTIDMGYITYDSFWNRKLAQEIGGGFDVIYSANCMCHIEDIEEAFMAAYWSLNDGGVFIFEDPSLLEVIKSNSYDSIYEEHRYIFSIIGLQKLLAKAGLNLWKVQNIFTHGGSNRIFAIKAKNVDYSTIYSIYEEVKAELYNIYTYHEFTNRVLKSKSDLLYLLKQLKEQNKKVIGYGATSKFTTIANFCGLDRSLISCVTDTTLEKQGKFIPSTNIPIVPPILNLKDIDYAFLGAWNYQKEIIEKETIFLKHGGKFITHVPRVHII